MALTKEYAILSQGQGEQHFHLNSWSFVKPKTPEQELRDDILDCDNFAITENKAMQLAQWLNNAGYIKKPKQEK